MNTYEKQKHLDRMLYLLNLTITNKQAYQEQLRNIDPNNIGVQYLTINIEELISIRNDLRKLSEDV